MVAAALIVAMLVAALAAFGLSAHLGAIYAVGVGIAAVLLVVENSLVHAGDYGRINLAFFTLNGVVSVVLAGAAIADILMHSAAAV